MSNMIHPAVETVRRALRLLWDHEPDHDVAEVRAMFVVQRLIECGHVAGTVQGDIPLVACDDDGGSGA